DTMSRTTGFIERHGLWSADQRRLAASIKARVKRDGLKLFRLAWADPHGASRAKTVTVPAFLAALENGHNINVAHDARRIWCAHVCFLHPGRWHGPGRNDRLAKSNHRA